MDDLESKNKFDPNLCPSAEGRGTEVPSFTSFEGMKYRCPDENKFAEISSMCRVKVLNSETEKYEWRNGYAQIASYEKKSDLKDESGLGTKKKKKKKKGKEEEEEEVVKKYLILYYDIPVVRSVTVYGVFEIGETEVMIPSSVEQVVENEDYRIIVKNAKLLESFSSFGMKKKLKLDFEDFLVLRFMSQSFMSRWIFHLQKIGKGSLSLQDRKKSEAIEKRLKILIETKSPKANLGALGTVSACEVRQSKSDWTEVHYKKWISKDVLKFLKCTWYSKKLTFYQIFAPAFRKHDVTGKMLSEIDDRDDLKRLGIDLFERTSFMEELFHLREKKGFFDVDRFAVFHKYISKNKEERCGYGISDLKEKFNYLYDVPVLCAQLKKVLFNLESDTVEGIEVELRKILRNDDIKHFQFNVKVLAVIPQEQPKIIEMIGMKLFSSKFETFIHLGLLIKNLQLDFYSNELVYVRSATSSNPWLCCDVDCILIEKKRIDQWVLNLAKEVVRWNKTMRYVPVSFKKEGNQANCQDFVFRMLKFLNRSSRFPRSISSFFERMKKEQKMEKVFVMTGLFVKTFKAYKEKIAYKENKVSLFFKDPNIVVFKTHVELDVFFVYCNKVNPHKWIDFYPEYNLLKSFDRGFHIAKFYAIKNRNLELHDISAPLFSGCPFNQKALQRDLFVAEKKKKKNEMYQSLPIDLSANPKKVLLKKKEEDESKPCVIQ